VLKHVEELGSPCKQVGFNTERDSLFQFWIEILYLTSHSPNPG
jgi:hypothetical protein